MCSQTSVLLHGVICSLWAVWTDFCSGTALCRQLCGTAGTCRWSLCTGHSLVTAVIAAAAAAATAADRVISLVRFLRLCALFPRRPLLWWIWFVAGRLIVGSVGWIVWSGFVNTVFYDLWLCTRRFCRERSRKRKCMQTAAKILKY